MATPSSAPHFLHNRIDKPKRKTIVRQYLVFREDQSTPIETLRTQAHGLDLANNRQLLQARFNLGRRVNVCISPEIPGKYGNAYSYRRLRQCKTMLSCPNPEQAELAIEAILRFAESLNGKWLAPKEDPTPPAQKQGEGE